MKVAVEVSINLAKFIEDIEYMQNLYANGKYTKAESIKNELIGKLDDLMRDLQREVL